MNPCGRITDLISCAFDSDCKFYRNDGRVQTVRFYEAADDAPVLGMWNVIDSGTNEPKRWPEWTLGGKPQPPVTFSGQKAPAGLRYDHVCGTPDDFANGALFDPLRPPLQIGGQGLPLCCAPPPLMLGAGGAGGKGVYHVISTPPITTWSLIVNNDYPMIPGGTLYTGGIGTRIEIAQIGAYLPATTPGWTFLGSSFNPVTGAHIGRYFKVATVLFEPWPTDQTGGGVFSNAEILMNGTGLVEAGAVQVGAASNATPTAVHTNPTATLVFGFWEMPAPGVPFTLPLGFADQMNVTWNTGGFASYLRFAVWQNPPGPTFTPGAGHWTVPTAYTTWLDSFF